MRYPESIDDVAGYRHKEIRWCEECQAMAPWSHKRLAVPRSVRVLDTIGRFFRRVSEWFYELSRRAQRRVNRLNGYDVVERSIEGEVSQ